MGLLDIAFPYRARRDFGIVSLAFVFVALIVEIELLVLVALVLVARRPDLFVDLQAQILPAAVLVSLASAVVFALRARSWSRARIATLSQWTSGASRYGEQLAQKRHG